MPRATFIFCLLAVFVLPTTGWGGDWPQSSSMASKGSGKTYIEDDIITIEGILFTSVADPSITIDGKPHEFPAIKLNTPLNFVCKIKDDFCQSENNITILHLALNNSTMDSFKKYKGSVVKVQGSLFHSETGHHFTPVLIKVADIYKR